jgi:hypothetical protein
MKIIEVEVKHRNEDGNKIVELQLKNSGHCVLEESAFDLLMSLGIVPILTVVEGSVVCRSGNRHVCIARLLLDCGVNETVRYLDNNRKNLRRSNLIKLGGSAKYQARAQIFKKYEKRVHQLRHVYE